MNINLFDDYSDYSDDDEDARGAGGTRCKRCGSRDVRWRQQGGRWVLFSTTPGVEHRCAVDADEFDMVDRA